MNTALTNTALTNMDRMNVDLMNPAPAGTVGHIAVTASPAKQMGKGEKAAHDFESVLLTSLFDSLEKTFSWDREDTTPGASNYRMMGTRALAEAVAAGGGIGIAQLILRHLPVTKVPSKD